MQLLGLATRVAAVAIHPSLYYAFVRSCRAMPLFLPIFRAGS